jgi:hypothetical protein
MIRLLGRAARQLIKKEYADQLIEVTQFLALAYRSADLLWAARASCILAIASISIESEDESELRAEIVGTVELWAWITLELRHLPDFLEAIQLLNGMLKVLPLADESKALLTESLTDLDLAFASQVLNFTTEELMQMERMPACLAVSPCSVAGRRCSTRLATRRSFVKRVHCQLRKISLQSMECLSASQVSLRRRTPQAR